MSNREFPRGLLERNIDAILSGKVSLEAPRHGPLARLEQKLDSFLDGGSPASEAARDLCGTLRKNDLLAYFFGGTLRDIWIGESEPRDLDVVVEPMMWERFNEATARWHTGRNRFGGTKMRIGDTSVDAWSIDDTWAFTQQRVLPACVTRLTETTILNAEAIVMEAAKPPHGVRTAYESGFFKGVEEKVLDTTRLPQVPDPALAAVRIRHMAQKLSWKIGPGAAAIVSEAEAHCPPAALAAAELSHYGKNTFWKPVVALPAEKPEGFISEGRHPSR